jgi:hypothetical protein
MNIELIPGHLQVTEINKEGTSFTVADFIGFSDQDGDAGFNRTGATFTDSLEVPYPQLDEAVLILHVYLTKYNGTQIKAPITKILERESSVVPLYEDVQYKQSVKVVDDGYYTIYGFLLGVVNTSPVYYDTTTDQIMETATGNVLTVEDLVDREDVSSTVIYKLITPKIEKLLTSMIGDMADLGKLKGPCSKEYRKQQRGVLYMEGQLAGAHVMFADGFYHEAEETIEDLLSGNPFINC